MQIEAAAQNPEATSGNSDGLGIYDENPNPVLRVSNLGVILYANRGSNALCGEWGAYVGDLVPGAYRQRITEAVESGIARSYQEKVDGAILQLQIAPVKGRDHVNIFGHTITNIQAWPTINQTGIVSGTNRSSDGVTILLASPCMS